ncbi:ATP-binding protein [Actinocorallia longicatena]|uniref:Helix-turn-helix transcriptional regulator n=1 Tax=Actinocorallia longicatena TaxID=111803 RepID=A0ABP6QA46_9ACTN
MDGLIGREHPAGVLNGEIERAVTSHGGLVLVTGEAGIGKSALVAAGAETARARGALVLNGACWDSDSAPGYWPWTQIVRALRRHSEVAEWTRPLDVLLGEASSAGPQGGETRGTEPPGADETDAFRLFDAVATVLVGASQERPVVVVLEDLHWADAASLRLLEFAAQHTWFERLLLIGTYRDVEVDEATHPLAPLMAPLVAKATTLTLTGLDEAGVEALISRTSGLRPERSQVTEVLRHTGGNPFFVEQTARLWRSGGSVSSVAPGVREAVRHRLSLLPAPVVELLTHAAVLGRRFHRRALAACAGLPDEQAGRRIERAVIARLVTSEGEGRFAFAHDLVRETLYDEADVRRLHAGVVRALDSSPEAAALVLPADLARHAHLAGTELPAARRVEIMRAASDDALTRIATDEAAAHLRRACEAVEDPAQHVILALDLGRTLHHMGGNRAEMWQVLENGAALARDLGDPVLLARAALILLPVEGDPAHQALKRRLLREAYGAMIGEEPGERPDGRLADELTAHIAVRARDGDDDEALAFSLWARHDTIWGLGTARERVALTGEMMDVARRRGDHDTEQFACSLRWVALLELGDPRFIGQWESFLGLAARLGTPRFVAAAMVDRAIIEQMRGAFAEAEALLERAVGEEHDHDHVSEFGYMERHLEWMTLLPQGKTTALEEVRRRAVAEGHPQTGLIEGINALQRGDVETALRHRDDGPYPRIYAPLALRFQAELAAATGDRELAGRVRSELAPHSGEWLVSLYGCDISGPVDLWLAVLDAAERCWPEAIRGFRAAAASADRLGARVWSVEARHRLARALAEAGDPEAGPVAAEAEKEAAELGMRHLAPRERESAGFRREGAVWALVFAGRETHMPDAKGLHDLHTLLRRPGAEIRAVELLDPAAGPELAAARGLGGDPVLVAEAKAASRRRLEELDGLIDDAAALGDTARAARLDSERGALLAELRTAVGLAGRDRRLGDEAERARKTVTARIRDTLRKLDAAHPELAGHLRASVSTGAVCSYRPDRETAWHL